MPEGLAVSTLSEPHRRRLLGSNPMERTVQQELRRRTAEVRVFPSEDSLPRLVGAILVETDGKRASDARACVKWEGQDACPAFRRISDLRLLDRRSEVWPDA